jgi:hypothetical protein
MAAIRDSDLVSLTRTLAQLPGVTPEQRACYRTSVKALQASAAIRTGQSFALSIIGRRSPR